MPKLPKMGTDWSHTWTIITKLLQDDRLDAAERQWLIEFLDAAASGEDVSARLTQIRKPSFRADRNFWIACDVAWHVRHESDAHETVVERWAGLSRANLKKIVARSRADTDALAHLIATPHFVRVIDWHRKELSKGTKPN